MPSTKLVGDESCDSFVILQLRSWECDLTPLTPPPPDSRRIINLSPVMVIPEEQPAQPALPIQPEGMRVVCGHCGNTFLVRPPRHHRQTGRSHRRRCLIVMLLFKYKNLGVSQSNSD